MSEGVIFSIGSVVFAMTVWGTVMAAGVALRDVVKAEHSDGRSDDPDDRRDPDGS